MKTSARFTGLGFAIILCLLWWRVPVAAQTFAGDVPSHPSTLAPADSYFGRFRMSVLGMRNAVKDIAVRVDGASPTELRALYDKLTMVEDAIFDLSDQYPGDSWLPQLGLSLAQAFSRMPFAAAQIHANDDLDWIIAAFPATEQAFYAGGMRRARLQPVVTMDVPIEPTLPSYAVPLPR